MQKKQGKNIFETLDQYENKTLGNLKSFTLSMKLNEWTLICIPFMRNPISLSSRKAAVTEF